MSGLQVVLGNVNGNESGGFNPGTRRIITTKKDRQRSSGGGGGDRGGRGRGDDDESHRDQPRRDRPRISIKDKREVSVSLHALGGAEGAAAAGISAEHVGSGLLEGTSLRRKVVDVRQRNSREAKLQSRREQEAQEKDVSSGFNTQGGQRRALIVLPKSAEKMAAREMLMQMHPHIAQVFRGLNPPDTFTQEPFSRILGENAPLMPYRRRQMEVKTVVQWAERRLFLWELEFLTSFALRPGTIVVYADCAPGTRIPYLASLFPHVSFVCVDPTSLDIDESAVPNVAVKQEAFSDALARQMRQEAEATGKTVLFISSATADSPVGGLLAEEYSKDTGFSEAALDAQKRFYLLLKPAKALLKFSLPWTDGSTHYLDGDVMLGVWNGPTSTEARIVPNGFQRTWSHRHFEEQMMHFNNVSRVSLHEHGVTAEGLDGCYDCTAEVYILERYLERYPAMTNVALGSQLDAQPAVQQPAKQLRLDTTRFNDPKWIASRALRAARLQQSASAPLLGSDGQPLSAEEREAALQLAEQEMEQAEMAEQAAASSSSAAAAATPAEGGMGDDPAAASSSSSATALPPPRNALEALKQNVGKFSQELSRRLTHNGQRTLATINNTVIKRAAFSRKNRL